jgi:hypothetical protein
MSRLGHSPPTAALRYQHATEERDRAIAERMSDIITDAVTKPIPLRLLNGR